LVSPLLRWSHCQSQLKWKELSMEDILKSRVTICIPCYNSERTIVETLESILAQDYPNLGVLVCDNASKDNTSSIVKSYESRGVKYVFNPTLKSAEDNWNFLLEHIPTDIFCLYHADDLYDPTMVSRQMELFLKKDVSAVFTMSSTINEKGKALKSRKNIENALPSFFRDQDIFSFNQIFNAVLIYSNFIRTPTLMTSRETIRIVGNFRYNLFRSSSDLDLWLRMSQYKPIGIINSPLHKYRVFNEQASFKIFNGRTQPQDYFLVIDEYLRQQSTKVQVTAKALSLHQSHEGEEYITCAINLLLIGKEEIATNYLIKALNIKNLLASRISIKRLTKYCIGFCLRVAIYLRLGKALANLVDKAYKKERQIWNK